MNFFLTLIIFVRSVLSFVKGCSGKYVEGHLIVTEKWYFVARFCFLSEQGQFEYFVEYSKEYAVQNLLLYYDTDYQWPSVYKTKKTCEEKESVLNLEQNQVINLTETEFSSGCMLVKSAKSEAPLVSCHNARKFRSARPRWWFLVVSHCNGTNGLNLKYKFLMTNGAPGDLWREHFSADEFYILPLLSTFLVMYIMLLVATIGCSVELKARQLLHSTYKLFALSVVLQEVGIALLCVAYIRFAMDGVEFTAIKTLGRMFESSSEICFLLLLLLLAKGYTTTRGRLRLASSVKLTIFMCAYVVTTLGLFVYEQHVFDPGQVLYLYESPAGYGLMILRVAAWWIFEYSTVFTLKHHPEKSNFYYPFNLIGTLWFVAGPCFTITANSLIDKWIRESIVCGVYHFIAISGHVLFFLLTIPSKANKNFPYHVRTSQIGVMEMSGGISGNNTLLNFGHHPYAPPFSLIGSERSHICSPDVPIELFSIHQSSDKIGKNGNCENTVVENVEPSIELKNVQTDQIINPDTNLKKFHPSSAAIAEATANDRVFSADRFIAPALRNNRTLSA